MALSTILSLGAGVQSSTLLLMAVQGEIQIDAAIFADTGWEPQAVYDWLQYLELMAKMFGIPLYRVSAGNLRQDVLVERNKVHMPLFVRNATGGVGMLQRQCTRNYKISPVRRELRRLGYGPSQPVDLLMGISLDEGHRMKDSRVKYIRHVYPLVDARLRRSDCETWLTTHGYRIPPKSACLGCPYHSDLHWRKLRDESPEEWADTVQFDRAVRDIDPADGPRFVHRSGVPLAEVDLRTVQDRGQLDLFGEECEGVCGV